jgi:hypothetical protein
MPDGERPDDRGRPVAPEDRAAVFDDDGWIVVGVGDDPVL